MLVVCWWSRRKHFSPLGTKLYFRVNSTRKSSIVLPTNMAALSRSCKSRIDEYLWRAANSTFLLYVIVVSFSLPTMHNISIQTNSYLFGHALAERSKSKYCPKLPESEYNKHPAFAWNWNKDSRRMVNSLWHSNQRQVSVGHSNVTRKTTSTRFDLKFFHDFSKYGLPESFTSPFFTRKVYSIVIFSEGGYALSRSQNDKTSNIWYLVFATTTFARKLVVEWRRLPRFPANYDAGSRVYIT